MDTTEPTAMQFFAESIPWMILGRKRVFCSRAAAPLFHAPICINVRTKEVLFGEIQTSPQSKRRTE